MNLSILFKATERRTIGIYSRTLCFRMQGICLYDFSSGSDIVKESAAGDIFVFIIRGAE